MQAYRLPAPPILTPFSPESLGMAMASLSAGTLFGTSSGTWLSNNLALFYPFRLNTFETAYKLLFFVGSSSAGNIDVGIYDSQYNLIVSSGSTAMSATVNTVQEINITDTILPPGDYFIAAVCSSTSGTVFLVQPSSAGDEGVLAAIPIYEQASALPLPSTATPVLSTNSFPAVVSVGVQFRPTF